MPSKIEKELTPAEVVELLETLAKTEGGGILRVIQEEAEKRGLKISLMSAKSFKDSTLGPYLDRLKRAKEKSAALADALADGNEAGLLAAGRTQLAEQISDFLMSDEIQPKQFSSTAMALNMLSTSNQGDRKTAADLKIKLAKYEREEAERKEAAAKLEERKKGLAKKRGVSKEAIELMEEALQLLG